MPKSILKQTVIYDAASDEENEPENDAGIPKKKTKIWSKADLPKYESLFHAENESLKRELTALESFEIFLDDTMCGMIADLSNRYATQKNDQLNVTIPEIKTFIAIIMLSGYCKLSRHHMFWEKAADIPSIVGESMRRDRFDKIKRYLHVSDNSTRRTGDKYQKVRPLISILNKKFAKNAPLQKFHAVDESMIPYFGPHSGKQFIKGKPIRYGFKVWCGCLPSGYCIWFDPYQSNADFFDKDLGVGGSVVKKYAEVLLQISKQNFHLVFDNYFTSLKLLRELSSLSVSGTGTIRQNRMEGCPIKTAKELSKTARGTYDDQLLETDDIICCGWNDNRPVYLASNSLGINPVNEAKRWSSSEKKVIQVEQPMLISHYNKYMGGIDRLDQNISLLRPSIRGKKWWYPIFIYCIDLIKHNAWQLYRFHGGKLDFLNFVRSVVNSILATHGTKPAQGHRRQGRPNLSNVGIRYDNMAHWPVQQCKQTRCAACHSKATTRCDKCDVGLHIKCYKDYHMQ